MLTWRGSCYCCSPLWFSKGKQQYHAWAYLIMKQLLLLHVLLFLWQIYSWHSNHNTHINHIYNTHIHCCVNFTNPINFQRQQLLRIFWSLRIWIALKMTGIVRLIWARLRVCGIVCLGLIVWQWFIRIDATGRVYVCQELQDTDCTSWARVSSQCAIS